MLYRQVVTAEMLIEDVNNPDEENKITPSFALCIFCP